MPDASQHAVLTAVIVAASLVGLVMIVVGCRKQSFVGAILAPPPLAVSGVILIIAGFCAGIFLGMAS